jgi:photosystem II stability/assembly factor-like uncharacterized protein
MPDVTFDMTLKNSGGNSEDLTLFSPVDSASQNSNKYSFSTPYVALYPALSLFTVIDGIETQQITLDADKTMAEVVALLNGLGMGTWSVGYNDSTNGNVFILLSVRNPVSLGIDNVIYYGSWALSYSQFGATVFRDVYFVDANVILVGVLGNIMRSIDNGDSFVIAQNLGASFPFQFSFLDSLNGWCCAQSRLYRTYDGGQIWSIITTDFVYQFQGIYMFDVLNGLSCGQDGGGVINVRITNDGGLSWTVVQSLTINTGSPQIKFFDSLNGVITGVGTDFWTTTNGGVSWTLVTNPTASQVFCLNMNKYYAVGNLGVVNWTPDGGNNWYDISPPLATENLLYAWAFSDQHIVVTGTNQMHRTIDGGVTWDAPIPIRPTANGTFAFKFRDQYMGICGERGAGSMSYIYKYS